MVGFGTMVCYLYGFKGFGESCPRYSKLLEIISSLLCSFAANGALSGRLDQATCNVDERVDVLPMPGTRTSSLCLTMRFLIRLLAQESLEAHGSENLYAKSVGYRCAIHAQNASRKTTLVSPMRQIKFSLLRIALMF